MMAMITTGDFLRSEDETEKGRCLWLLAIAQLSAFSESAPVRNAIADDLGLSPRSLFPGSYEEARWSDARMDAVISLVRVSHASQEEARRASFLAKTFYLVIGTVVVFLLYRAWSN